ncbi:hypothetical protein V8G54_029137 [Vigna mungo]|uniref:Uncharacterized protein n=1 Tax=Vigna mungo TaxID=3915 RepID=A0AAQ3RK16_VIGMU
MECNLHVEVLHPSYSPYIPRQPSNILFLKVTHIVPHHNECYFILFVNESCSESSPSFLVLQPTICTSIHEHLSCNKITIFHSQVKRGVTVWYIPSIHRSRDHCSLFFLR